MPRLFPRARADAREEPAGCGSVVGADVAVDPERRRSAVLAGVGAVEADADGAAVGRDAGVPARADDGDVQAGLGPGAVPAGLDAFTRVGPGEGEGPRVDGGGALVRQRDRGAEAAAPRVRDGE